MRKMNEKRGPTSGAEEMMTRNNLTNTEILEEMEDEEADEEGDKAEIKGGTTVVRTGETNIHLEEGTGTSEPIRAHLEGEMRDMTEVTAATVTPTVNVATSTTSTKHEMMMGAVSTDGTTETRPAITEETPAPATTKNAQPSNFSSQKFHHLLYVQRLLRRLWVSRQYVSTITRREQHNTQIMASL
jgi:hypothetical protein